MATQRRSASGIMCWWTSIRPVSATEPSCHRTRPASPRRGPARTTPAGPASTAHAAAPPAARSPAGASFGFARPGGASARCARRREGPGRRQWSAGERGRRPGGGGPAVVATRSVVMACSVPLTPRRGRHRSCGGLRNGARQDGRGTQGRSSRRAARARRVQSHWVRCAPHRSLGGPRTTDHGPRPGSLVGEALGYVGGVLMVVVAILVPPRYWPQRTAGCFHQGRDVGSGMGPLAARSRPTVGGRACPVRLRPVAAGGRAESLRTAGRTARRRSKDLPLVALRPWPDSGWRRSLVGGAHGPAHGGGRMRATFSFGRIGGVPVGAQRSMSVC